MTLLTLSVLPGWVKQDSSFLLPSSLLAGPTVQTEQCSAGEGQRGGGYNLAGPGGEHKGKRWLHELCCSVLVLNERKNAGPWAGRVEEGFRPSGASWNVYENVLQICLMKMYQHTTNLSQYVA